MICKMWYNLFTLVLKRNWSVKRGNSNPVSWNSLMNSGKKSKTGRCPQKQTQSLYQ